MAKIKCDMCRASILGRCTEHANISDNKSLELYTKDEISNRDEIIRMLNNEIFSLVQENEKLRDQVLRLRTSNDKLMADLKESMTKAPLHYLTMPRY